MRTEIIFTALEPIHHSFFGPKTGNASAIRRMRVVSVLGMPRIPCVSGNAIRGVLRRIIFRDLFHRAEILPGQPGHERLPPKSFDLLYAALAKGGHFVGSEAQSKTEHMRQLRESLPPLSVFGSSLYNFILPGHFECGIAWLRCRETHGEAYQPAEDLVEEISHCRHIDREYQSPEITEVTTMPTEIEVICKGAELQGWVNFSHAIPVERAVIGYGLRALEYLGAKKSIGLGRVKVDVVLEPQEYVEWLATTPIQDRLVALAEELLGIKCGSASKKDAKKEAIKVLKEKKKEKKEPPCGSEGQLELFQ